MRTFLHRLLGLSRARGFDAAGGGRRWEGARTVDGLNAAILAGATTAARRAGWYARNNPWVAAAVNTLGIVSAAPGSRRNVLIRTARCVSGSRRCSCAATLDGLADFYWMQDMAVHGMVESGFGFASLEL